MTIKMLPTRQSSNIAAIGYDEPSETLRVAFNSGGSYDYANVPKELHKNFLIAPSLGKFFAQVIKGRFPGVPSPAPAQPKLYDGDMKDEE